MYQTFRYYIEIEVVQIRILIKTREYVEKKGIRKRGKRIIQENTRVVKAKTYGRNQIKVNVTELQVNKCTK